MWNCGHGGVFVHRKYIEKNINYEPIIIIYNIYLVTEQTKIHNFKAHNNRRKFKVFFRQKRTM